MKPVRFCCIWMIGMLLAFSCLGKVEQKKVETSEGVSYALVPNQVEGLKIIGALSKAYGDNSNVTGDFIGSIRCLSFLEGYYFGWNTLVFQVRGDTLRTRKKLEAVSRAKLSASKLHFLKSGSRSS